MILYLVVFIFINNLALCDVSPTVEHEKRLHTTLFKNYNKNISPTPISDDLVYLVLDYTPWYIVDVVSEHNE
jgi:hypothetical protein